MTAPASPSLESPQCPLPLNRFDHIVIGHGSGGSMTSSLIREVFQSRLGNEILSAGNDAALVDLIQAAGADGRLVISTDAHIVSPLFFPGGDIGRLAVCGSVNDVAVMGARVKYLTASFILEEGLPLADLERIVDSMAAACAEAGVQLIAADTKVTERGKSDGLFISTTGIGWAPAALEIAGSRAQPGDVVLVSGPLGNHGIAVAQARGNLGFQSGIVSDTAPLNHLIEDLLAAAPDVHCMRDATRGGLATTLVEISQQSAVGITLEQTSIPVDAPVQAACDLLGLDPLYLANEGKITVILPEKSAGAALRALQSHPYGRAAALIGRVSAAGQPHLTMRMPLGTTRVLDMLAGEMLPRIC